MIFGIYFSPTGNTKKVVESMAKHLSNDACLIDMTCQAPKMTEFSDNDFVIIGTPVYAGRIPEVARHRIEILKANHSRCVIVASYGNRHYDDTLKEMATILKKSGFIIHGACSVIGRHTYGNIQVDRPNEDDLNKSIEFISTVYNRNLPIESIIPGSYHEIPMVNKGRFHPQTNALCIKCKICFKNCPVQAISEDCNTISEKCISCFRCIRNCPYNAKNIDSEEYYTFAQNFSEKLKERRENEYFI